jgi:hypothetical protein
MKSVKNQVFLLQQSFVFLMIFCWFSGVFSFQSFPAMNSRVAHLVRGAGFTSGISGKASILAVNPGIRLISFRQKASSSKKIEEVQEPVATIAPAVTQGDTEKVKRKRKTNPSKGKIQSAVTELEVSNDENLTTKTTKKVEVKAPSGIPLPVSNSSKEIAFCIYGQPQALQRHRFTKLGLSYNPSAKQQKQFLEDSLPFLPKQPLSGPIEANINFFFEHPKAHYRTGKNAHVLRPEVSPWFTKKPGTCSKLIQSYLFFFLFFFTTLSSYCNTQ